MSKRKLDHQCQWITPAMTPEFKALFKDGWCEYVNDFLESYEQVSRLQGVELATARKAFLLKFVAFNNRQELIRLLDNPNEFPSVCVLNNWKHAVQKFAQQACDKAASVEGMTENVETAIAELSDWCVGQGQTGDVCPEFMSHATETGSALRQIKRAKRPVGGSRRRKSRRRKSPVVVQHR